MSLWTSIRDTVVGAAPTIIGAAIGGPAGATIGNILGGAVARQQAQTLLPMPQPVGNAGPGGSMVQTAGTLRALPPIMGAMRGWLVGARGIVTSATGALLGVMRGQKLFRNAQVLALAKQVGIDAAAVALGVTAVDVAQMIAAHVQRRGRRHRTRGISGRDIKCTRRTMRKFHSLARLFHTTSTSARRRSPAGATLIRQG
jgi:hypothetical protein